MRKFFKGLVVALAATFALGCASAATTVETTSDYTFDLTMDTTGAFTADDDEYARAFLQSYGADISILKVSMVVDGKTVDVTDFAVIDGTDGNNTLYINSEKNKDESIKVQGYSDDAAVYSKVTSVTYTIKLVAEWTDDAWFGGAIGTNSKAGWNAFGGQWTSAAEADDAGKMFYIVKGTADAPAADAPATDAPSTDAPAADSKTDDNKATGDATSVAVLAVIALAAMSGAVVVSKKRA